MVLKEDDGFNCMNAAKNIIDLNKQKILGIIEL